MFISRTTREERVTIETALDSAFLKIDQAEQLMLPTPVSEGQLFEADSYTALPKRPLRPEIQAQHR